MHVQGHEREEDPGEVMGESVCLKLRCQGIQNYIWLSVCLLKGLCISSKGGSVSSVFAYPWTNRQTYCNLGATMEEIKYLTTGGTHLILFMYIYIYISTTWLSPSPHTKAQRWGSKCYLYTYICRNDMVSDSADLSMCIYVHWKCVFLFTGSMCLDSPSGIY